VIAMPSRGILGNNKFGVGAAVAVTGASKTRRESLFVVA
jgi:hypothetical protein